MATKNSSRSKSSSKSSSKKRPSRRVVHANNSQDMLLAALINKLSQPAPTCNYPKPGDARCVVVGADQPQPSVQPQPAVNALPGIVPYVKLSIRIPRNKGSWAMGVLGKFAMAGTLHQRDCQSQKGYDRANWVVISGRFQPPVFAVFDAVKTILG
jgi:hypothetical protein